jgi:hypothetical protein
VLVAAGQLHHEAQIGLDKLFAGPWSRPS